jgi:hypothetical protein
VKLLKPRIPGVSDYLGVYHFGTNSLQASGINAGTYSNLKMNNQAGTGTGVDFSVFSDSTASLQSMYYDPVFQTLHCYGLQPLTRIKIDLALGLANVTGTAPVFSTFSNPNSFTCAGGGGFYFDFANNTSQSIVSAVSASNLFVSATFIVPSNAGYADNTINMPSVNLSLGGTGTFKVVYDCYVTVIPPFIDGVSAVLATSASERLEEIYQQLKFLNLSNDRLLTNTPTDTVMTPASTGEKWVRI